MDATPASEPSAAPTEPLLVCHRCRRSSPLQNAYQDVGRWGRQIKLCPRCNIEASRRTAVGLGWWFASFAILGTPVILLDDPCVIEEARSLAANAYHLMPWSSQVATTFGMVEALHGDAGKALEVLKRVDPPSTPPELAVYAAVEAAAHARVGRVQQGHALLCEAEALDPTCDFLPRVQALPAFRQQQDRSNEEASASCTVS